MKKLLVGLVAVMVAVVSLADSRTFRASGDLATAANWVNGIKPNDEGTDDISIGGGWWDAAMRPVSLEGHLNGATYKGVSLKVYNQYRDEGDTGLYPVTVYGEGGCFDLGRSSNMTVESMRKAVFDNVLVTYGNTGGSGLHYSGWTELRNGTCVTNVYGTTYLYAGNRSKTVIDGSQLYADNFSPYSGAEIVIRNGGRLGYKVSSYTPEDTVHNAAVLARVKARVIDGDVHAAGMQIYTFGFLPERSGTLTSGGYTPVCAADGSSAYRLGGTARCEAGNVVTTNSIRFYGDGKLYCNIFNAGEGPARQTYLDLAEHAYKATPSGGTFYWGDGLRFGYLAGDATMGVRFYATGDTTFLSQNPLTGAQYSPSFSNVYFLPGAGAHFSGGATISLSPAAISDRFATFEVGDGTTVNYYGGWYEFLRTHDFRLGRDAVLAHRTSARDYYRTVPCVTGTAEIDPTATLKVYAYTLGQPIFRSLDEVEIADAQVVAANGRPAGWEVWHVGGSYYFATNNCFAQSSLSWCAWTGRTSGNWSTVGNWQSFIPGDGKPLWGAYFPCTYDGTHMVTACVTNDYEDLSLPFLYATSGAGPHIIRGNTITLTSGLKNTQGTTSYDAAKIPTGSAISAYSQFPFIVEAPIHATGDYFGVVAGGTTYDASVIALKGDVMVDKVFAPSGDVVIGGKLTAADLELNPMVSGKTQSGIAKWRGTVLTIRGGGEVEITDPTVSQTTGMVWIAKGGSFKVDGDFSWTDASMIHRVDGTLSVAGQLTGTGVETYYGKGKVAFGGIAAGTTAKFGQGVTIAPTTAEASKWTGNVQIDGKVAIAPEEEMTLPSTFTVVRPGSVLDFAGGEFTVLAAAPTGADYDVRVTGKLAIADDMTLPWLTFEPGATLAFAAKANGTIPTLTVNGNVDLTGVRIVGYADEDCAAIRRSTLLTVPEHFRITGTPAADDHYTYAVVDNEEGGQSLVATYKRGLMVILR